MENTYSCRSIVETEWLVQLDAAAWAAVFRMRTVEAKHTLAEAIDGDAFSDIALTWSLPCRHGAREVTTRLGRLRRHLHRLGKGRSRSRVNQRHQFGIGKNAILVSTFEVLVALRSKNPANSGRRSRVTYPCRAIVQTEGLIQLDTTTRLSVLRVWTIESQDALAKALDEDALANIVRADDKAGRYGTGQLVPNRRTCEVSRLRRH
jgi:hypothetical protein